MIDCRLLELPAARKSRNVDAACAQVGERRSRDRITHAGFQRTCLTVAKPQLNVVQLARLGGIQTQVQRSGTLERCRSP